MLIENLKQQRHFKRLSQSIQNTNEKLSFLIQKWLTGPRKIISTWHKLHANQKIYVLAIVVMMVNADQVFSGTNNDIALVGCIALIAMIRELWELFTRIWDTMFGKSIVLVLYAIVANFTLSLSAQKINIIVGVSPSELIYTQGLTTLMMLPFWILLLSVLALTFVFVGAQIKTMFFGILRILRLHHITPSNKEHYSGIFLIIRLIVLPIVIMTLAQALTWYSDKIHIRNLSFDVTDLLSKEQVKNLQSDASAAKQELKSELEADFGTQAEPAVNNNQVQIIVNTEQAAEQQSAQTKPDAQVVTDEAMSKNNANEEKVFRLSAAESADTRELTLFDRAIASFVYHFEAFEYSRCKTTKTERAVPLNENDILVVEKDDSDIGFKFSARACELKEVPHKV